MQQTEKYKLNLIESSDPFLPDALNRNTQKVEDAMSAHESKLDGQTADLDRRVTALEARQVFCGTYEGIADGRPELMEQFIYLGARPKACAAFHPSTAPIFVAEGGASHSYLRLADGGFYVSGYLNNIQTGYCFLAFT